MKYEIASYQSGGGKLVKEAERFLAGMGYSTRWLAATHLTVVMASNSHQVAGCGLMTIDGQSALLMSFAVDPLLRKQQIGTRLVRVALEELKARGVRQAFLFSRTAGRFWERFGFRVIPIQDIVDAAAGHYQVQCHLADGSIGTDIAYRLTIS